MGEGESSQPKWYLGQLGENVVALVVESPDRDAVDSCVSRVCESFREPVTLNGTEFRLAPYAGVAIRGLDSPSHKTLLDHARDAAAEARRAGSSRVFFFSDTMQLKSLARLDVARELRAAIANGDIGFRYVGRYDLTSGRLAAWVGYLRWQHPLRGEIRPSEFLRVAETTGLALSLSRSALSKLPADFARLNTQPDADVNVRISFGALRDHILHEDFVSNIETFLADSNIPAERLELRIAEKAFVGRSPDDFHVLQQRNIQLVVDEIARDMGSLPWLARAPIWGLQLDRAWVTSLLTDDVARKVCRAGISVATSLGLTPIATGVDTPELRDALLSLGCEHGSGDLYDRI
jgi:EAL domain-containing protein (putative c-di-GMP-specific phosphodiesterase class I)